MSQSADGIAILVLTHNRVHLLQKCVENVLLRTSEHTREIVIWDNGSTDGTPEYLATIEDPRFKVIRSEANVGHNGYARGFRQTTSPYLVEMDDDMVDAPHHWDATMLDAFKRLPDVGFLAADLVDDPHDEASRYRYEYRVHEYQPYTENGVNLLTGPAGGGCAMTTREISDAVGGWEERPGEIFWVEDGAYINAIQQIGYRATVMADLKLHHTGGPYYTQPIREKTEFWRRYHARQARRDAVKRVLVRVPGVRRLNARHSWFVAPD
jgi:GT2 family glycosyltransferase